MRKVLAGIPIAAAILLSILAIGTNLIVTPAAVLAADEGKWGDEYTNDKGQHICICSDTERDCQPCYNT